MLCQREAGLQRLGRAWEVSHSPTAAGETKPRKAEVGEGSRPRRSWLQGAFAFAIASHPVCPEAEREKRGGLDDDPEAGMGPCRAGWAAAAGTTRGGWGQADALSVNSIVTCHLSLAASRQVAAMYVFCTLSKVHSCAAGLHGAWKINKPQETEMSPSLIGLCSPLLRGPIWAPCLFLGSPLGWACRFCSLRSRARQRWPEAPARPPPPVPSHTAGRSPLGRPSSSRLAESLPGGSVGRPHPCPGNLSLPVFQSTWTQRWFSGYVHSSEPASPSVSVESGAATHGMASAQPGSEQTLSNGHFSSLS